MPVGLTKEFKEKWLTALTDGSFHHFTGKLKSIYNDKERCCLGVARAIMGHSVHAHENYLTDEEQIELGLDTIEQTRDGATKKVMYVLAEYNDACRVPEGQYYPQEVIDAIKAIPTRD